MDVVIAMALLASFLLILAAWLVGSSKRLTIAEQYKLASEGPDKTVIWHKSDAPQLAKQAALLQDAIIQAWPASVRVAPDLVTVTGPRQVRFALHEAMIAEVLGYEDVQKRFCSVLLGLSWAEWNADLHATLMSAEGHADLLAAAYAEQVWQEYKDKVPTLTQGCDALTEIAKTRIPRSS